MRGHLVVAVLGGGIDEHAVVEHHRPVEHHRRDHVEDKERQRLGRKAQGGAGHGAGAHESDEELLLVALKVGEAAQKRHQQGEDQRRDRLGVAPGDDDRRTRFGDA